MVGDYVIGKYFSVFFAPTRNITYLNKRKKYVYKMNFTVTKKPKRGLAFLRFTKYFFFKKKWKKKIKNFMKFDLYSQESLIYEVYKIAVNKLVLKK